MTTMTANTVNEEGQCLAETLHKSADPATINELLILHRHRRYTMTQVQRINNGTAALVRSSMGFTPVVARDDYDTDKEHKAAEKANSGLKAAALKFIRDVERGQTAPDAQSDHAPCIPYILHAAEARRPFDTLRKGIEKRQAELVRTLAVWPWAEAIPGLAEGSIAAIVGECGDLSNYANPGKVWKRMGLAPHSGKATTTWKRTGGLTSADWIEIGDRQSGRTVMFNIGESLLKKQSEYRDLYLERLAVEVEKAKAEGIEVATSMKSTIESWENRGLPLPVKVTKLDPNLHRSVAHVNNRAKRYVWKRLLRNLWKQWN